VYNQRLTYTYDNVANRASLLELAADRTTWTYDATYRRSNRDTRPSASSPGAYFHFAFVHGKQLQWQR
jgi:hypothetical protein